VAPHHFGRECEVLDQRPTSGHTELRDVEVRIASIGHVLAGMGNGKRRVVGSLGGRKVERRTNIPDGRIGSEQAARPLGVPVVVERTTDAPSLCQLERAVVAEQARRIDGIRGRTEANVAKAFIS
jgi:hypothetical protein